MTRTLVGSHRGKQNGSKNNGCTWAPKIVIASRDAYQRIGIIINTFQRLQHRKNWSEQCLESKDMDCATNMKSWLKAGSMAYPGVTFLYSKLVCELVKHSLFAFTVRLWHAPRKFAHIPRTLFPAMTPDLQLWASLYLLFICLHTCYFYICLAQLVNHCCFGQGIKFLMRIV